MLKHTFTVLLMGSVVGLRGGARNLDGRSKQ